MTRNTRQVRAFCLLAPVACLLGFLLAAGPTRAESTDDLIRLANDALRAGNTDRAEELYAKAEEHTTDPGLVAFNRAAVFFDRGLATSDPATPSARANFLRAAQQYRLVLDDRACPPARAARAWYNRGTCLLHAGAGGSPNPESALDAYRTAIACFERAADTAGTDEVLRANAKQNLVVAKLRWNEERKKANKPDASPNDRRPDEETRPPKPPEPEKQPGGTDPNGSDPQPGGSDPQPGGSQAKKDVPGTTTQPKTGKEVPGPSPQTALLQNTSEVQQLTEKEARDYLDATAPWRKKQQRAMLETLYGPERAGIRDW